jgi:hypothetical protein
LVFLAKQPVLTIIQVMYDTKSNQLSNLNVSIDKGTNEANASVVVHLPHLMPVARICKGRDH